MEVVFFGEWNNVILGFSLCQDVKIGRPFDIANSDLNVLL